MNLSERSGWKVWRRMRIGTWYKYLDKPPVFVPNGVAMDAIVRVQVLKREMKDGSSTKKIRR